MSLKLVVFGGGGLLGREICIGGAKRGMNVFSVGSQGKKWTNNTQIECIKADVFNPESYRSLIMDADIVVSSIGILLESNYKPIVNSKSISELITNLTSSNPMANPMERIPGSSKPSMTYERYNRDSALILANTLVEEQPDKKPTFVYISADRAFPGVPRGYIDSKREAELQLFKMENNIRPIVLRPGLMYNEGGSGVRDCVKTLVKGPILNQFFPSNSTEGVSNALFRSSLDKTFQGIVPLNEMN